MPLTTAGGKPGVGKGVSVLVGVNNSAPICVTVGVNVIGVLVEVAKRFCVGAGVSVENGVAVSVGGTGVGVIINRPRSGSAEQPASRVKRMSTENFFFMEKPFA